MSLSGTFTTNLTLFHFKLADGDACPDVDDYRVHRDEIIDMLQDSTVVCGLLDTVHRDMVVGRVIRPLEDQEDDLVQINRPPFKISKPFQEQVLHVKELGKKRARIMDASTLQTSKTFKSNEGEAILSKVHEEQVIRAANIQYLD